MFKEKFIKLCSQKGVSPTSVCLAIGLSNSAYTQWSEHSMPRKTTLVKICDYFGVSYDYFDTNQNLPEGTYHGGRLNDNENILKKEPTILAYSGNERIDSIAKEILKTNLTEEDIRLIEFILDKYKK